MELRIFQLILFLFFIHLSCSSKSCFEYYETSRETCTGWWEWGGCGRIYSRKQKCCDKYITTSYGRNAGTCSTPRCHGRYGDSSCSVYEGYVKHKDGTVVRNSGGHCYAPGLCTSCNKGYYPTTSNDGYCKACPKPANCNLPVCKNQYDTTCEYCEGEFIREKPGYNIYSGKPNNKICQRACSWSFGARCFPGTCGGDMILNKDCKCTKGFGGADCATANRDVIPTIKDMSLTFQDSTSPKLIVDKALGNIFWTNQLIWSQLVLVVSSHYKAQIEGEKPNYITNYHIGVEEMQIHLTLTRGSDSSTWPIDGGCTNFNESCDYSLTKQINSISPWQKIFHGNFFHGDRIEFRVSSTHGGKVFYQYRSVYPYLDSYPEKMYILSGITTTETLVLGFDEQQPEHCFEQRNDCTKDSLTAKDFLREPKVLVQWDGWTDRDSGIDKYEFNIYHLKTTTPGGPLIDGNMISTVALNSTNSSALLNLTVPGPYSIEITVHDRAGNHKTSRRIILFDNVSVVELYGNRSKIAQANDFGWINKYSKDIEVVWPGRFRNVRHSNGGWLNEVQVKEEIQRDLDDRKGRSERTVEKIDNIEGIVRFEIANLIELNGHSTFGANITVPDKYFHSEKIIYDDVDFEDGKKLTYFIRGVDAVGEYAEDNVTAMIDLSPPIIQNLWLTKGTLVNISVHSVLELKDLTIEWEAFDYHSGLHEVHWKLFDNYTKNVVVHGKSHEPPQGETETLDECKNTYEKYPRGSSCYCSPYNGCFHKHYQIKPQVIHDNSSGGLLFGKEIGEHDYDYYIEVTVINNAGLTTVKHKKV